MAHLQFYLTPKNRVRKGKNIIKNRKEHLRCVLYIGTLLQQELEPLDSRVEEIV